MQFAMDVLYIKASTSTKYSKKHVHVEKQAK